MIAYIDIKVNAAHPNIPLAPLYAFVGSPSNVRVIGVPQQIGKWNLTAVSVTVTLPDNSATTVPAVPVAGCWVATLPSSPVTGYCAAGLQVTASGVDENGNAVTGYCLGVGDVTILSRDASAVSNGKRYYLHLVDEQPENPNPGDMCYIGGVLKWYDGTAWQTFGADVEIVAPSTDAEDEGKAADAYATGTAMAAANAAIDSAKATAGFSPWRVIVDGEPFTNYYRAVWKNGGWVVQHYDDYGIVDDATSPKGAANATEVDWSSTETGDHTFKILRDACLFPADATLTPVPYGDWVFSDGVTRTVSFIEHTSTYGPDGEELCAFQFYTEYQGDSYSVYCLAPNENVVRLADWQCDLASLEDLGLVGLVATRRLAGYVLGNQTGRKLAPQDNPNFAPLYSATATYAVGALCVKDGILYRCTTAIGSSGEAWNSAHWAATDVKTELAGKQDALSVAQLANIAAVPNKANSAALRYDLVTITTGQLQDRAVQKVELNAASTTLVLPALTDLTGKVSDFGIDMVNAYEENGTAAAASFQLDGTLGTDYNVIIPKGETWSDMTALAAGEMAQFYFTLSSFQFDNIPTWKVVKQVVELVPVPTAP